MAQAGQNRAPPSKPWYHKGLRFRCLGCGRCCTGAAGYVWVNGPEIAALAAAVGLDPVQFEAMYVRVVGRRKSLIELPNGDCVFFDNKTRRCKVYRARPSQCRAWPFWASNLRSPETWAQMGRACPGSGRGTLVPAAQIEREMRLCRL